MSQGMRARAGPFAASSCVPLPTLTAGIRHGRRELIASIPMDVMGVTGPAGQLADIDVRDSAQRRLVSTMSWSSLGHAPIGARYRTTAMRALCVARPGRLKRTKNSPGPTLVPSSPTPFHSNP